MLMALLRRQKSYILDKRDKQMIPKKIHYCWFGGKEKPNDVVLCINSWKK